MTKIKLVHLLNKIIFLYLNNSTNILLDIIIFIKFNGLIYHHKDRLLNILEKSNNILVYPRFIMKYQHIISILIKILFNLKNNIVTTMTQTPQLLLNKLL